MLWMFAALVGAQTTTCDTLLNRTTCETQPSTTSNPDAFMRALVDSTKAQPSRAQPTTSAAQQEIYARAVTQVGELIGKGDCTGATRLAQYYGYDRITQQVRAACPGK